MLDLAFIRANPDIVKDAATRKRVAIDIDHLLALDTRTQELRRQVEAARARQNQLSKDIQAAGKDQEARIAAIEAGRAVAAETKVLEPQLRDLEVELRDLLLRVPNIPDASVPTGRDESENVEFKKVGTPRDFGFTPQDHVAIMARLDMLDVERGVRVAGSRSYILKGDGVRLEMALIQFAIDRISQKGFTPLSVPALAREFCFIGNSQFPRGKDQVYALEGEGEADEPQLFLVGTAEVAITGMHSGEILDGAELPIKYVGVSPCFRKEAGTYGKDTKGIMRVHQFTKVEQYIICQNDHEESVRWHEALLANAEDIVTALEMPYHVVLVCTGDLGDGQVKKYDIECWVPSEGAYRETHSDSYFHDYQARRANVRYRDAEGKVRFVHTLNNTALASPRIMIPLLENHQQADGSVTIPPALRPYLGGQTEFRPKR
ncbi:MAG: serine--tRNA ligase [Ktedonobacterales bacterium]|nr:serine--tRNA ligase [Ktedonobacterales bacterium]